jgi:hypothetical protein
MKEAQPVVPESWAFVQGRTLTAAEGGSGMFWKVALGGVLGAVLGGWGVGYFMRQEVSDSRGSVAAASVQPEAALPAEGGTLAGVVEAPKSPAPAASPVPAALPAEFMGVRLGTAIRERLAGKDAESWRELGGRFHRPSVLHGAVVEAVLLPDAEGRLLAGAYVRVEPNQPAAVTPFLEWAVGVQESLSGTYGEPTEVHQVAGTQTAEEVVAKIGSGEDFYQALWKRPGQDVLMSLSIRRLNERSVVFRLQFEGLTPANPSAEAQPTESGAK